MSILYRLQNRAKQLIALMGKFANVKRLVKKWCYELVKIEGMIEKLISEVKTGTRVLTFGTSLFGGSFSFWGTIKQTEKNTWVIFDNPHDGQKKCKFDNDIWMTDAQFNYREQKIKELNKQQERQQQEEQKRLEQEEKQTINDCKHPLLTDNPKIGQTVQNHIKGYIFEYLITKVDNHGYWGIDKAEKNHGERFLGGSINENGKWNNYGTWFLVG